MEYRDIAGELGDQQVASALTGVKIEEGARDIVAGLAGLETAMAAGTDRELVPRVQALQIQAAQVLGEAETHNRQLADERETGAALRKKFDQYEVEKNGEIARWMEEAEAERGLKEKARSQARTRLVMVIALSAAWVLFIAYKVAHFLRVIP
jgi:hypothetical protein